MKRLWVVGLLLIINIFLSGCQKYDVDRDVLPPGTPYTRENNAASVWFYIYPDKIEKRFDGKIAEGREIIFTLDCYIKAVNLSSERCLVWIENDDPSVKIFSGLESSCVKSGALEKISLMSGETRVFRMPMQSVFTIAFQIDKGIMRERWTMRQVGGDVRIEP